MNAATVKFCVSLEQSYVDSGQGSTSQWEDYWADTDWDLTDPAAHLARGAYFEVYKDGVGEIWDGFLGDSANPGIGCTAAITVATVNGSYDFTITSYGRVNGNDVEVKDDDLSFWSVSAYDFSVTNGNSSQSVEMDAGSGTDFLMFNIYQAVAWALYRHNGGNYDDLFAYELDEDDDGPAGSGKRIGPTMATAKFVIVHEAGHVMGTNSDIENAIVYGYNEQECHEYPDDEDHSMRSKEWVGAAVGEGFAHFYAADVWNNHTQTDCWFEYYKPVYQGGVGSPKVNCETASGTPDFPTAYLEHECSGGAGTGVELDWLRVFWDVHTNSVAPNVDPTFTEMVDWMVDAGAYDEDQAYDEINTAANARNDQIDANWNQLGVRSAVDGVDDQ